MATPATALTLWDAEHDLAAFVETVEMVEPDSEQEFLAEFSTALTTATDKRDRVSHVLTFLESMQSLADQEINRLELRKAAAKRAFEKLESYVVTVIESLGMDAKGKYKKLEGKTTALSLRACPPSVKLFDESQVPTEFKTVAVKLPAPLWEELMESLDMELRKKVLGAIKNPDSVVSKSLVKTALDSGVQVPGADLLIGKQRLVRS